jgi:glycine oxidase
MTAETPPPGWDVAVIGGGLIGLAAARALARAGASVGLLERQEPARGATWAAGGMLSPLPEAGDPAFLALATASLDRYPAFVADVEAESGQAVGYRRSGKLHVAFGAADAPPLEALLRSPHGDAFGVRALGATAARRLEPALSHALTAAVLVERDHQVDNRALGSAAVGAARAAGVQLRAGATVRGVAVRGGGVRGVRLADGQLLRADAVVVAAGSWSGALRGLPRPLPVIPVRGEMVALRAPAPLLERVVMTPRCYLIPRADGRLLVGATEAEVGYAPGPTAAGVAALLAAAIEAVPACGALPVEETWCGYRPGTPDRLPFLGADPEVTGLVYATGHYRNGILLAPITAAVVEALLTGEPPPIPLDAFRPDRFVAAATVADRVDFAPDYDPEDPVPCERCGGTMAYTASCKLVCPTCGYTRDCSDP